MNHRKVGGVHSNVLSQVRNHGSSRAARSQKRSGSRRASSSQRCTTGVMRREALTDARVYVETALSPAGEIGGRYTAGDRADPDVSVIRLFLINREVASASQFSDGIRGNDHEVVVWQPVSKPLQPRDIRVDRQWDRKKDQPQCSGLWVGVGGDSVVERLSMRIPGGLVLAVRVVDAAIPAVSNVRYRLRQVVGHVFQSKLSTGRKSRLRRERDPDERR